MKFFQLLQANWLILGIGPNQHPFTQKLSMAFAIYSLATIFAILFILNDASDFMEYINSIYQCAFSAFGIVCIINTAFRTDNFVEFIGNCEKLVVKST